MHPKPTILSTTTVAQSRLFQIENVHLRFSNGEERHYERLMSRVPEAVMIVGIHNDALILVKEYAVGIESYTLGFPKGLIDPGESALEAAHRELQEEAGFGAEKLHPITTLTMNPGYTSLVTHIVLAENLYPSALLGDEPEPLEMVRWPLSDLNGLLANPAFRESRSVAALMWVERMRQG